MKVGDYIRVPILRRLTEEEEIFKITNINFSKSYPIDAIQVTGEKAYIGTNYNFLKIAVVELSELEQQWYKVTKG